MTASSPYPLSVPRPSARRDLAVLRSPRGLHASAGDLFVDAIFGRDQAEAAEDLLDVDPEITRQVILALAHLQGTRFAPDGDRTNEEEPGRIHHEARSLYIEGRRISAATEAVLSALSEQWGGTKDQVVYYGTVDATPLYVRLVTRFCARYGTGLLDQDFVNKDGEHATVRDSVLAALGWITGRMASSPLGMVEFKRRNPRGIVHQAWKDSSTSYIHSDGTLANHDEPIASVEVQGLAYDALTSSARLFGGSFPELAEQWLQLATRLRDSTLTGLWMPDEQYMAMGSDRDSRGRARLIRTLSSNPATLLDTEIFDQLPEDDRRRFITGIVRKICGREFLTDAGIRCRALRHYGLVPFCDYHGSGAVWPKESFDIARGLRRQGLGRLAQQIEFRILNAVNLAGLHLEFFYVMPDGLVGYDTPSRGRNGEMRHEVIAGTNVPDHAQLWTVSAVLAIKQRLGSGLHLTPFPQSRWQWDLENAALRRMTLVPLLKTGDDLRRARRSGGWFSIDTVLGRRQETVVLGTYGRRRGPRRLMVRAEA